MDVSLEYAQELLADPERRARAQTGTRAGKRLASAIQFLSSCAADAIARGAPPTTRLELVAEETVETCKRLGSAVAAVKAVGFRKEFPAEATFAADHLAEGTREIRSFVPGLADEIDALPLLDRPGRESKIQVRYTYAASRLKREQVTVSCYTPSDWRRKTGPDGSPGKLGGFVELHGAVGRLAPVVCHWLDRLTYGRDRSRDLEHEANLSQAVLILAHESEHAAGIRNEAKAECYGMQETARLARLLGVEKAYAEELAEFVWERWYPFERPPYYSAECRPGGKLDLHPRSSAWP
jgi:hypothetical protein